MLRFFRQLRQKVLKDNKVTKYLLYALGEVVLVIIGILIAVSLNNANEARKQDKKIRTTLSLAQQEIRNAVNISTRIISFYAQKDSLVRYALTTELSAAELKVNRDLLFLIKTEMRLTLENDAYHTLVKLSDDLPEKYTGTLEKLKSTYQGRWPFVEQAQNELADKILAYNEEDVKEAPWASDYLTGNITDEAIDYFLNDFRHKNRIASYWNSSGELVTQVAHFRTAGIYAYREINSLLSEEHKESLIDLKSYTHWVGRYESGEIWFEIETNDSSMLLKGTSGSTELFPVGPQLFHIDGLFGRFRFSGDSTQVGINLTSGLNELFLKKVR
ncbi:MAG: hypothetical protein HEP71_00480 [Roseivirga sp.]|nr:hypothetical protein [Roseivirga sp.]